MSWKNESLDRLFNPKSIAVIGASDKIDRLGFLALESLRDFQGITYPINPRLKEVKGLKCYSSIIELPETPDLALICIQGSQVIPAIEDCKKVGTRAAVIYAAGFKELNEEGEKNQQRLKRLLDSGKIAVIGPNCLGAGNLQVSLNATFFPYPLPPNMGNVSLVSQSGGVTGLMLYQAVDSKVGISKFASVGNRVNIGFHDMLRYLRDDDETDVICLFVEGTDKGRKMYREIKQTTKRKPVLMYKVGTTPSAKDAALSHTGSLAGEYQIYSSAIKQAGGIEVHNTTEMMDTAKIFAAYSKLPSSKRVAIITHTLGVALIAAQTLEENSTLLPLPEEKIVRLVRESLKMPDDFSVKNPIDLLATGWARPEIFGDIFSHLVDSKRYDSIVAVFSPNYREGIGGGVPVCQMVSATKESDKIVIAKLASPILREPPGMRELENEGIPCFNNPQRAGKALANVLNFSSRAANHSDH